MPPKLLHIPSTEARPRGGPVRLVGTAVLAAMAIALFLWGWSRGSDARVIAHMAPADRATLFQVTRSKAEVLCANPRLEDRCLAEVDLLSEFPECGTECREFVARHRAHGSR